MGLAEKRKLKELQDTTFPARQKELAEICGTEINYDVGSKFFDKTPAPTLFSKLFFSYVILPA